MFNGKRCLSPSLVELYLILKITQIYEYISSVFATPLSNIYAFSQKLMRLINIYATVLSRLFVLSLPLQFMQLMDISSTLYSVVEVNTSICFNIIFVL